MTRRLLPLLLLTALAALAAPGTALAVPPSAEFNAPTEAYTGETVTLTIAAPEAGAIYTWDFGNGQPAETGLETTRSTSYSAVGQHTITVTASNGVETSTPATKVIRVGRQVPSTVDFVVSNNEPVIGETIEVDAPDVLADYATDGHRCRWTADSPAAIEDPGACHTKVTWTGPGTKDLRLRVTDVKQQSTSASRPIRVSVLPPPPNKVPNPPSLSYSPSEPVAGQSVTFTSTATDPDGTIETYEWDFNSDTVYEASGATATHVFAAAGNYTVTVRATDNNGGFRTSFQTIFVSSPPAAGEILGTSNSGSPPTASTPSSGQGQPRPTTARLLSPFPIVRLRGSVVGRTARITLLSIQGAPRGAKVRVRCRGGGCPRKLVTSTARSSRRTMRLRSFERRLRAGAKLEIYITQSGRLGKYTRFEIRRNAAPRRVDRCVRSFPGKPFTCPATG